jgi:hypothetical protein
MAVSMMDLYLTCLIGARATMFHAKIAIPTSAAFKEHHLDGFGLASSQG